MRKKLKSFVTSAPILGSSFLSVWRAIKPARIIKNFRNLLSFSDTHSHLIDDTFVVFTTPYIDQQDRNNDHSTKNDLFYLEFENVFRGSKEAIKSKQAEYIKYVYQAYKLSNEAEYFFDVGCGRGEFLELLDAAKIPVKGLEKNEVEYEALLNKGFNVKLGNCNSLLENISDGSLIGISAFQVIEHFEPEYLQRFIKLSYEKIATNGVLILETVNPKCHISLSNFFLDITHIRPYPPETIKFLLEWYGFKDIRIIYSTPCSKEFRIRNLKEYNYMDYGIIAYKK